MAGLVAAALWALTLAGCSPAGGVPLEVAGDEIILRVQLELGEGIGLLVYEYAVGGATGGGGVSNADGILLKRDDFLTVSLNGQQLENPPEGEALSLQISIVTEYAQPNYENSHPPRLTVPMDPIRLVAVFGQSYDIAIRGGQAQGYQVEIAPYNCVASENPFRGDGFLL